MKKVILYPILMIAFGLLYVVACAIPCDNDCGNGFRDDIFDTVRTNLRAYGILKEGMSIDVSDTTLFSSDTIVFDISLLDIFGFSTTISVVSRDEQWLYPGVVAFGLYTYDDYSKPEKPLIDSNSNRNAFVPYWELSASFGDTVTKKVRQTNYTYGMVAGMQGGFAALSNKLDSIKLVCINKQLGAIESNNSLASLTLFEAQQFHKEDNIGYTLNTLVNSNLPPYEVSHRLSEFKKYKGFTLLNIASFKKSSDAIKKLYLPWRFTIARGAGDAPFSGDYIFKLFFYFDDGALTVESNEFTVRVGEGG